VHRAGQRALEPRAQPAAHRPRIAVHDRDGPHGTNDTMSRMSPPSPAKPPRRWVRRLRAFAELATLLIAIPTLLMWCSIPNTAVLADENPTSSAFIELRRDAAEDAGKRFDLHWEWRPLPRISRYLRAAVVYSEDIRFYEHDGVDWEALEHAFQSDLDGSKIGGSTITQQLAKNLYLSPARSVPRKAREMLIAFSLEDHLDKTRILELYLNVVEWGDGVFGAEAAAHKWFGRSAATLTPAQAARLATALPNPIARNPNVASADLTRKRVRLIDLMHMQGLIDTAQEREALTELGIAVPATTPLAPATESAEPRAPREPPPEPPGQPVTHPSELPDPPRGSD
jgi:monofunctional biosynthetic peptidoglycan transglycosylase